MLGEGAGGDDALGEFGANFGEVAEGFKGGGVDVDGGGCGVFAEPGSGEGNEAESDEGNPEPAHLAVVGLKFFLTLFDEVVEGFTHGFECGCFSGRSRVFFGGRVEARRSKERRWGIGGGILVNKKTRVGVGSVR